MSKTARVSLLLFLTLLLSACSWSLAEDIQPPPNYRPPVMQSPVVPASGSLFPLAPANLENGRAIYTDKCAPCHGEQGRGDGPQAADLPNPVAALGHPDVARQAAPEDWYQIVSEGNLDRFMPPFRSLTVNERWDVVAYAYSLSAPSPKLEEGQALYQENCAACHGPAGAGDGTQAAALSGAPADLASAKYLAQQASRDFFAVVTHGAGEMPAFETELSESQRWAVSDYLRSQTFAALTPSQVGQAGNMQTPAPAATADPDGVATPAAAPTGRGTVRGTVVHGAASDLEPDMLVTLHNIDLHNIDTALTLTTTVQADGSYVFEDVDLTIGRLFWTTTDYQGTTYTSQDVLVDREETELDLPIAVYSTTTDASVLLIDRLHIFFEFLDEDTLRVIELFVVSNLSQQTLVAPAAGQPVVSFSLPAGATNLQFQQGRVGQRFLTTPDGFGDTVPILPGIGSYQVLLAFEMPFDRKLELVQPMRQSANALVILVPDGIINVTGKDLVDAGPRPVEDQVFRTYNGSSLRAGEELRLTVSGSSSWAVGPLFSLGNNNSLLIGLAAFGLALLGSGAYLFVRSRGQADDAENEEGDLDEVDQLSDDPEELMDAILALDDQYQSGELPETAYQQRRAELKARLLEISG